ncbi:MAG: 50S ribosomal protein L28 [Alphaproteobacteria bacterium CG11_big_fil_rev_8_21_14_0_20_39_49]|nr:MAG: 50S ribosomal protein L28 [Alphaproteobacteria bacterium CG11_big_fil_rev_8_21_14_0_20_39_49]
MAKRCELTGVGVQSGNNVSHSNRKTRRRFIPNLHRVSLSSRFLNQIFRLRITAATLRSIDHNGGLDGFLLNTNSSKLTETALKIKRKIKKSLPEEVKAAAKADAKKPAVKKDKSKDSAAA